MPRLRLLCFPLFPHLKLKQATILTLRTQISSLLCVRLAIGHNVEPPNEPTLHVTSLQPFDVGWKLVADHRGAVDNTIDADKRVSYGVHLDDAPHKGVELFVLLMVCTGNNIRSNLVQLSLTTVLVRCMKATWCTVCLLVGLEFGNRH